jgi:hypothetical protein
VVSSDAPDTPAALPTYGGAMTFEELAAYEDAMELAGADKELADRFQIIVDNVMQSDKSVAERAAIIAQAASDLATLTGEKYNDNRDELGRFASGDGGGSTTMEIPGFGTARAGGFRLHDPLARREPPRVVKPGIIGKPSGFVKRFEREKPIKNSRRHTHAASGEMLNTPDNPRGAYGHEHSYDYEHSHKAAKEYMEDGDVVFASAEEMERWLDAGTKAMACADCKDNCPDCATKDGCPECGSMMTGMKDVGEKFSDSQERDDHGRFAAAGGTTEYAPGQGRIHEGSTHSHSGPSGAMYEHAKISKGGSAFPKGGLPDGLTVSGFTHEHDVAPSMGPHAKYDDARESAQHHADKLGRDMAIGKVQDKFMVYHTPSEGKRFGVDAQREIVPPSRRKEADDEHGAFAAFKDASGAWRWAATWSNNFVDRDGEVFPDSAHKEYEAYVDQTHDYPELWLWHMPGSKSGKADMIAYDDGFCLATGTFDADKADIAEGLARAKDLGVSHGYTYAPHELRNGEYLRYRTFEISPLPGAKASNIGTSFAAIKEAPMLTAEKRDWLVKTIGEDRAAVIEENHQRMRKELTDRGISYKEFVEALAEGETNGEPVAEPAAAEPAAEPAVEPAAEPAAAEPAADDPEDGEKAMSGMKEAIVAAVTAAMEPVATQLKEMRAEYDTKLDALKQADDEKIANAWASKAWGRNVPSATDDSSNLVDGEKASRVLEAIGGATGSGDPAMPYVQDLLALIGAGQQ